MNFTINDYNFGERPDVTKPNPDFLKFLGEDGIRKLVSRHYDLMKESEIGHLFAGNPATLEMQKQHSADFMIQICGGTDYYNQRRGKPMMINRHAGAQITKDARIIWLNCYKQALIEVAQIPDYAVQSFWDYINVFSAWMINTPDKQFLYKPH